MYSGKYLIIKILKCLNRYYIIIYYCNLLILFKLLLLIIHKKLLILNIFIKMKLNNNFNKY